MPDKNRFNDKNIPIQINYQNLKDDKLSLFNGQQLVFLLFYHNFNRKTKVNNLVEWQNVLHECTSNENWNVSNTKLQLLADHTYNWQLFVNLSLNRNDYNVIMKHLWKKLNIKPSRWRQLYKALHAMEYLIKNGCPRVVQEIKDDLFKIRAF